MLPEEKRMELLEAYDLTKSYRAAAQLTGVNPHTVTRAVAGRAIGIDLEASALRSSVADAFVDKITEWIERSGGKVRADVVHDKLRAMGYTGSERTTRRVVAALKESYRRQRPHRVYKPWITEPGMWLQYDFGDGPVVHGVKVVLFCAWLAWSRFRVILPLGDRSMPSVIAALDRTFRLIGGASTYVLTDNEKTVTDYHLCGIAVRNEAAVAVSRYYGITICTCVPFDPESKGGSESSVKVAKADLVPTDYNLLAEYDSFGALEATCGELQTELNARPHSVTRRPPAEMLEEEQVHLHGIPDVPYTAAFGESRLVGWSSMVSFRGARYSVPHRLAGGQVWVRVAAGEVVIVAARAQAPLRWPATHCSTLGRPPSVTSTTPSEPVIPSTVSPGPPSPPRRPSSPWARGPSSTSARRPPPGSGASSARWPRRSPWLASTARRSSTELSGWPPWLAASRTATSSRSSCTPRERPPARPHRLWSTRLPPGRAPGRASAPPPRCPSDRPGVLRRRRRRRDRGAAPLLWPTSQRPTRSRSTPPWSVSRATAMRPRTCDPTPEGSPTPWHRPWASPTAPWSLPDEPGAKALLGGDHRGGGLALPPAPAQVRA